MADDNIQFKLDLDAKDFVKALKESQDSISTLGSADNLKGLISAFDGILPLLGAMGTALLVLKSTMDLVFEGERIKAVNQQFEILTKNAGLSTDALKEGLENAGHGLIDTTDLLQIANQAIVNMGGSANKLPEILELARKSAALTGKDVEEVFKNLTFAIETGNQRLLKHNGIVIDTDKAYQKYADSVNTTVGALTESEKRQAVLNEVLDKGQKSLAGVDDSVLKATNTWKQLLTTIQDIKEAFATLIEKTLGDVFTEKLKTVSFWARTFGAYIKGWTGNAKEAQTQLKQLNDELNGINQTVPRGTVAAGEVSPDELAQRNKLRAEQEAKFQKELTAIAQQGAKDREAVVLSEADVMAALNAKELDLRQAYEAQVKLIETNKDLHGMQQLQLLLQAQENYDAKSLQLLISTELDKQKLVEQSLRNQALLADGFFNKFAAGAKIAANKAKTDFLDFATTGEKLMTAFGNSVSSAFAQAAQGSIDLGTAMRQAVLGALADVVQAKGAALLTEGIFTLNPLEVAGGLALSALAGVLRSAAGGGSTLSATSVGGGGGAAAPPTIADSQNFAPNPSDTSNQATAGKSVTIQVQGHYFETEQTRTRLVDLIRDAGDISDFKAVFIGGTT